MASQPTRAQIQTQWSNASKILDQIYLFGNNNSPNFLGLLDTLQQSYLGEFIDEAENAAQSIRSVLAGSVSASIAQALLRPFLKQYCRSVIQRTDLTNDQEMLDELYRYLADNGIYLNSRNFTFGTPTAAGGNTGTTQIVRLTRDDRNYQFENGFSDSKRAICVIDENTGVFRGQEVWQIKSSAPYRDALLVSGSGAEALIGAKTIDDSLLNNPGFRSFSGTAGSPTGLTGWTSSAGDSSSIYTIDQTNFFRAAPSDGGTSSALKLEASTILSQKLTVRGTELDNNVPYMMFVIWNGSVGSASGTLTFRKGSVATSVVVASNAWTVTPVPSPIGQGAWYRQFRQDDLQVQIQWAKSSGTPLIGEVLLVPGTFYDGCWHWIVPSSAAYVAPKVNDQFNWTDYSPNTGRNQYWIARAWGRYMPHSTGSSVGWADV